MSNSELGNRLLRLFRLSEPELLADEFGAPAYGLRFMLRTRIGGCAGFGSPGSITSGSDIGGSGRSPGFSTGGGTGSGTGMSGGSGGILPGGTPGAGAGGLGTCCPSSSFSKAIVLSARAASGTIVAFADDELHKRHLAERVPKKRPAPWNRKAEAALTGRLQVLELRLEARHAATGKLERLSQAVACHVLR